MECGGLSVIKEGGTPWMPLWCVGNFATSTKVRTLIFKTIHNVHPVVWPHEGLSTRYTLKPSISIASYKNMEVCYSLKHHFGYW